MTDTQTPEPAAPAYPPAPATAPTKNGLGLAALIIGIVAGVLALIPIVNFIAGFVAFVGLVLGVVALFLKNKAKGIAAAGSITSGAALILSIVMPIVYTALFFGAVADSIPEDELQQFIEETELELEELDQ